MTLLKKKISISSLQTDYITIDSSIGCANNSQRVNIVQTKCIFLGYANNSTEKCFIRISKKKQKARAAGDLDNRRTERMPWKYFRCGPEDHLISKRTNPPKDNEKRLK